ncbi:1,5-anhydro-D-fructose reductase-like [Thrips palmi]|uniref:1,5-anhydro-D-fructose reductase-like n=1 Tax=Thrips palmi TaxID=161013 RepID=A0A6P8YV92_THRPL|nr:1,5-anhydro-D-fructose reductase-like [Thrips palmi]
MSETVTLANGAVMPMLGLGTWQATDEEELEGALNAALDAGYRFIDTAYLYANEKTVGKVVKAWLDEGKVTREELFISTKLPMMGMREEDVSHFLGMSLENLQLDYVDLYLVHVPFGMLREAMQTTDDIKAGGVGTMALDMETDHLAIWKALEAEVEAGRARAIGVSNFNESQVQRILDNCTIPPANHQVEMHLYLQQKDLVAFCKDKGITVTAYSPFGSPGSNKWLTTSKGEELPDLFSLPEVVEIADRYEKTPAQVLLRHFVQQGILAVPKSTNAARIQKNIQIFDFELTEEEVEVLSGLDRGEEGRIFTMKLIGGVEDHPEYPWKT